MYLLFLTLQLFISKPVFEANEVSGTIISEETKSPIDKAYLYVVKGEEEATTDANGNFRFTTWQDKPVKIFISHKNFKSRVITLNGVYRNLRIVLAKSQ
ncbi:carboxypeptidase-like regulatory domain-containing protein [Ferruginibacter sp. HRS2-29]|uniref:carboxypeptidase-like regulatory domain-containing protein n=1 Tax=Ferruginibacter sp. HRS2-29 TaxID=2487334 RepID=UPI0020CBFCE8|nr:carboxypeptidase-like regulatory domain-containing protein [Ferruginibacter sp. HRS2-29]MCP9749804.1 hypothetical protein [Ferruginibacter sp. HRS2-29]